MSLQNRGDHGYRPIPSLSYLSIAMILGNDSEMAFRFLTPSFEFRKVLVVD